MKSSIEVQKTPSAVSARAVPTSQAWSLPPDTGLLPASHRSPCFINVTLNSSISWNSHMVGTCLKETSAQRGNYSESVGMTNRDSGEKTLMGNGLILNWPIGGLSCPLWRSEQLSSITNDRTLGKHIRTSKQLRNDIPALRRTRKITEMLKKNNTPKSVVCPPHDSQPRLNCSFSPSQDWPLKESMWISDQGSTGR